MKNARKGCNLHPFLYGFSYAESLTDWLECSRSSRQTPASSRGAFKRLGTDAAKMAVAAGSVVERLDVVEDISAR